VKRALETVNFVRSSKVVFAVLGFIFGGTLIIIGLTHTETVGLFQKEAAPLWGLVAAGASLVASITVLYVLLSWMEQILLALVIIATGPDSVRNTTDGYRFYPAKTGTVDRDRKTADERRAAGPTPKPFVKPAMEKAEAEFEKAANQAMDLGNSVRLSEHGKDLRS